MYCHIKLAVNFTFNPNDPVPSLAAALFNGRIVQDGTTCQVVGWNPITPGIALIILSFF